MSRAAWLGGIGLWLLLTGVLAALYSQLPPCPDHAVYDYIGWVVNQGGTMYVDSADQNWPGQMLIHTLSVAMFGSELWSYRAFELLVIIPLSCFILFRFLRAADDLLGALLVVPIYQAMYVTSGFWMSGQREIVAAPLLVAAAHCMLSRVRGDSLRAMVVQGVLIAAATLIRPTLLIMAPLLTLADVLQMRQTGRTWKTVVADHAVVGVSIILPIALLALSAVPSGALAAWYDVSVRFNLEVYAGGLRPWEMIALVVPSLLWSWHWYFVWSGLGAFVLFRRDPLAFSFVGMLLPAALVSFFVQAKGFEYHLGVLLPLMAVLIASAAAAGGRALGDRDRRPLATALAAVLLLLPAAGLAKKIWRELRPQGQALLGQITMDDMYALYELSDGGSTIRDMVELAEHIKATTPEDATVLFWERPCYIYTLTGHRSPFFAAAFTFLQDTDRQFSLFPKWKAELETAMVEHPPDVLLLVRDGELGGYRAIPKDPGGSPPLAQVVRTHLPEYQLEKSVGGIDLYRRTDSAGLAEDHID